MTLTDDGGTANGGDDTSATKVFTLTINAVNDPPSFTKGSNQSDLEDAGSQSVAGWATAISKGPSNESSQTVSFLISSNSNPSLFSAGPGRLGRRARSSYTPAPDANGSATIGVEAKDNGGVANGGDDTSAEQTFTITVTAGQRRAVVHQGRRPGCRRGRRCRSPSPAGRPTCRPVPPTRPARPCRSSSCPIRTPALFAVGPGGRTRTAR